MLLISSRSEVAIAGLAELAMRGSKPVPIAAIAEPRELPLQSLESAFAQLRRSGIVRTQRGVHGGYCLSASPEKTTVLEVVELLDGEVGADSAEYGSFWPRIAESVRAELRKISIADVARREAFDAGVLMYQI